MFPALDPITIREKKAKEVFLLFKRTTKLNNFINREQSQINTKKKNDVTDVTGLDTGWY